MSPRLFLHGDSIVSLLFHSPRRLDGLSGSAGRLPAGSYSSRFASLSSLRGAKKGRTSSGSSASVSQPRTTSSSGLWLPFPPSSTSMDDWLILASSELIASVSRLGNLVFAFYGSTSSRRVSNLLRLLEEFLSTPSPPASLWHRILGHLSYLTGCSEWGCSSLASRINGISWTTSFRSPGSLSVESFLLWWTRVAQLREGVSFSLPVPEVSFLSDASDVGCGPS